MSELDVTTFAEIAEAPQDVDTSGSEYCHIVMEQGGAYCGSKHGEGPLTCKPYSGEAICPSCGLATCPACAVMAALNDRLEEM